jgi:hypothetical protein
LVVDDLATFGSTAMVPGSEPAYRGRMMELFRAEKFGDLEGSDDYYPETKETIV